GGVGVGRGRRPGPLLLVRVTPAVAGFAAAPRQPPCPRGEPAAAAHPRRHVRPPWRGALASAPVRRPVARGALGLVRPARGLQRGAVRRRIPALGPRGSARPLRPDRCRNGRLHGAVLLSPWADPAGGAPAGDAETVVRVPGADGVLDGPA